MIDKRKKGQLPKPPINLKSKRGTEDATKAARHLLPGSGGLFFDEASYRNKSLSDELDVLGVVLVL